MLLIYLEPFLAMLFDGTGKMLGVIPIIFASSILSFPATIARLFSTNQPAWISNFMTSPLYAILYFLLIIFFTYFYTSIQFNPIEIANNMKKSGGYIPGYRPGKPTSDFIASVSNKLNLAGAIFLGIVAIMPIAFGAIFNMPGLQLGGTSLLIMEGVALETVRQMESQMTMRHYKGFLD